jgi:hypothetical protein
MALTLEEKQQLVLRYIPLGMSLEDAMFYSEMTDEDIDATEADERFSLKTRRASLDEQHRLLSAFDDAMELNLREGKTGELRYKLGLLNPKRFGDISQKASSGEKGETGLTFNFKFDSQTASLKQSNVEIVESAAVHEAKAEVLGIEDGATGLEQEDF